MATKRQHYKTYPEAAAVKVVPRGEDVFNVLFKNGAIDLVNEPLCKADIKLHEQLALAFQYHTKVETSRNNTIIKSSCAPSKFEKTLGSVIDVWECTVKINENNKSGEFVSSSTIVFDLTLDKKEFLKGSLRCR